MMPLKAMSRILPVAGSLSRTWAWASFPVASREGVKMKARQESSAAVANGWPILPKSCPAPPETLLIAAPEAVAPPIPHHTCQDGIHRRAHIRVHPPAVALHHLNADIKRGRGRPL